MHRLTQKKENLLLEGTQKRVTHPQGARAHSRIYLYPSPKGEEGESPFNPVKFPWAASSSEIIVPKGSPAAPKRADSSDSWVGFHLHPR